jgi:glutamate dehydrogenase
VETALSKYPDIARHLVALFRTLHDPKAFADKDTRKQAAETISQEISTALAEVPSADDDRIIRTFEAIIAAMLRTNFFQTGAEGEPHRFISFKLASRTLDIVPAPRPLYEIFVYAPDVEGVHLRFGKVARGGIRWSDRPEDFRTEILSLVKAQQVKNAVIVPVGAKGGFYPKHVPANVSRDEFQKIGVAAYKTFIGALLDLTDNIGADGAIVPPQNVLRYDDNDPYLVVAADKGTATFSDIANGLAEEHGFWLGDAFASGGSQGYDHKKMGITARGAWEAVKRHFREMGRDIQSRPFTCIGVGDMSGDVFGNGMLLSKQTRLLAAFDHRHIFFDPEPDIAKSWAERKRLFDLPRSSWDDFDKSLISKGGGVFPRGAKEIPLNDAFKKLTGLKADAARPQDIIKALLTAEVDLLFFGGIGTYIKAQGQANADAGDRANDALRVNGRDIRASVVGEGANLGCTQLGRVEYAQIGGPARKGGRINTDAIDNSAGVDTSDHEVNLKILMSGPVRRGELKNDERTALLFQMTEEVAALVLKDNYDQTEALSVMELRSVRDLDAAQRFIRELEKAGTLDRAVEQLPDDEGLRARARAQQGLTRPELAVLLAYAKLDLFEQVIESPLPDDAYLQRELIAYFPPEAVKRFPEELQKHRLHREIVATQLANKLVNIAGPLFVQRLHELSRAPAARVARAFVIADGAFGLEALKAKIDGLDLKIPAAQQIAMMSRVEQLLRRLGLWFVVNVPANADIGVCVKTYSEGVAQLKAHFGRFASPFEQAEAAKGLAQLKTDGVPEDLAQELAAIPFLAAAPEIVLLAQAKNVGVEIAASAYAAMGAELGLDKLRSYAATIAIEDYWDRMALRRIFDDFYAGQRILAAAALADGTQSDGAAATKAWTQSHRDEADRTRAFLEDLEKGGGPSLAKLSLANSHVQKLAEAAKA